MKKNIVIIILAILVLGMGGYLVYDKILSDGNEETVKEENKVEDISEKYESLVLDEGKCLTDCKNVNYTLMAESGINELSVSINNISSTKGSNEVEIYVDKEELKKIYLIDSKTTTTNYKISFSKKVQDVYVSGIGHDISGTYVFFLMEDGSVEYMNLFNALENENFNSHGKLEGVENIVKFYKVAASPKEANEEDYVGGIITVLAQKSDGSFYDLEKMLSNN